MRMGTRLLATVLLLVPSSLPQVALAKTVSIAGNSESELRGKCQGKGVFFGKNRPGGHADSPEDPDSPYGCLGNNGSLVVCGGGTATQKKTCSVSRIAAGDRNSINQRVTPKPRNR